MSYYNGDDIAEALRTNQLDSDDDDIMNALNGNYDDINDDPEDNLESFMDADEDREYIEESVPNDEEVARTIIEESQGVNDEGLPNAAISIALDLYSAGMQSKRTVAQQAIYKPVITINKRMEFIEFIFDFLSNLDSNLKILLANINKYADQMNLLNDASDMAPVLTMTIVPISGLGSYYMTALNPVMWALDSESPDKLPSRLKIMVRAEDVGFFQTDEIDLRSIESAVQREQAIMDEFEAQTQNREAQKNQEDYLAELFGGDSNEDSE